MNWQGIKSLTHQQVGVFLALMIVVFSPNYGIEKYGPNPAVPSLLLAVIGVWMLIRDRAALFAVGAQRRLFLVFGLILVPAAISAPFSLAPRATYGIIGGLVLYFLAGLALVRALHSDSRREWLAKAVSLVLVFWVADSLIQFAFGFDLFGVEIGPQNRLIGPFAHNIHMPVLLMLLLPLMLFSALPFGTMYGVVAFFAASSIAIMSGSRTMLYWALMVGIGWLRQLPRWRWRWVLLAVVVLAIVATLIFYPILKSRYDRFVAKHENQEVTTDALLSFRSTVWGTASNMLKDRPLQGVGAGAFQSAYARYASNPDDVFLQGRMRAYHTHQLYVGMAAETGLIGLGGLITLVVLCLKWYLSAPPGRRARAWPWGLGLVVYAFPINSQSMLYTQWLFPILLLLLAGLLAALDEDRAQTE